eukprot:scaffold71677_cov36-Tisochrysis_lutea.AAC.1
MHTALACCLRQRRLFGTRASAPRPLLPGGCARARAWLISLYVSMREIESFRIGASAGSRAGLLEPSSASSLEVPPCVLDVTEPSSRPGVTSRASPPAGPAAPGAREALASAAAAVSCVPDWLAALATLLVYGCGGGGREIVSFGVSTCIISPWPCWLRGSEVTIEAKRDMSIPPWAPPQRTNGETSVLWCWSSQVAL